MNLKLNGHVVKPGVPTVYYISNNIDLTDYLAGYIVLLVDCKNSNLSIILPSSVGTYNSFTIKKIDSTANTVILYPNGVETIDSSTMAVITNQYTSITLVPDGANWYII